MGKRDSPSHEGRSKRQRSRSKDRYNDRSHSRDRRDGRDRSRLDWKSGEVESSSKAGEKRIERKSSSSAMRDSAKKRYSSPPDRKRSRKSRSR